MSAEIDADVDAMNSDVRRELVPAINALLARRVFAGPWLKWDVIVTIMRDHAYKEIVKAHKNDMSLEFRLKIDHAKFAGATLKQARGLVLEMLTRSTAQMAKLGVPESDIAACREVLHELEQPQ